MSQMTTRFLARERQTLEELMPGLDARLAAQPLPELEQSNGVGLAAFKACRGPALLISTEHSGTGADPCQAVRVQRAIGARSPSLAIATTMHHFSVASLVEASRTGQGFEWMLLEAVAQQGLLMASGFAEGRTGQAILSPMMTAEQDGDDIIVSGTKKPCSLSQSMDLLTASVSISKADGTGSQMAVALIPKGAPGMTTRPFWNSFVLAGAESDEVLLENVRVSSNLVVRTETGPQDTLDDLQTTGFLWFELLMAASYLGMASALGERVLNSAKVSPGERAGIAVELEAAMGLIEGIARGMMLGLKGEQAFAEALVCRFAVQDAISRAVARSVEALGGMAFIQSSDVAYLAACTQALGFHPPSRARMSEPLCDYFAGAPLIVR
jgi:alkylation response protein AidB-like acyl-CoA dehydrogenase